MRIKKYFIFVDFKDKRKDELKLNIEYFVPRTRSNELAFFRICTTFHDLCVKICYTQLSAALHCGQINCNPVESESREKLIG